MNAATITREWGPRILLPNRPADATTTDLADLIRSELGLAGLDNVDIEWTGYGTPAPGWLVWIPRTDERAFIPVIR